MVKRAARVRLRPSRVFRTFGVAAAMLLPLAATATAHGKDLIVDSTVPKSGVEIYDNVMVSAGGTLLVAGPAFNPPGPGWLHLKAQRISIADGGSISAIGQGHVSGGPGGGVDAPAVVGVPSPGGGAGHISMGGNGATAMDCVPWDPNVGGASYNADLMGLNVLAAEDSAPDLLGSSGGMGFNSNQRSLGAAGGGV